MSLNVLWFNFFSNSCPNGNILSTQLNEVYKQLEAIEADKAPARAGMILNGLGYTTFDQQRPTR